VRFPPSLISLSLSRDNEIMVFILLKPMMLVELSFCKMWHLHSTNMIQQTYPKSIFGIFWDKYCLPIGILSLFNSLGEFSTPSSKLVFSVFATPLTCHVTLYQFNKPYVKLHVVFIRGLRLKLWTT
jgi:hypothetical protein